MTEWPKSAAPLPRIAMLAVAALALIFAGVNWVSRAAGERSAMETPTVVVGAAIPPIDAIAPAEFETATFALG